MIKILKAKLKQSKNKTWKRIKELKRTNNSILENKDKAKWIAKDNKKNMWNLTYK